MRNGGLEGPYRGLDQSEWWGMAALDYLPRLEARSGNQHWRALAWVVALVRILGWILAASDGSVQEAHS